MRILYIQYTNPAAYPPLQHSSTILANQGWNVLFLGTGAQGAAVLELPSHPRIEVRRLKFCPSGWRQKVHYVLFVFWVFSWVLSWRPKWVYLSDPLSCPIAYGLSFVPGIRLVYHEHDSPDMWQVTSRFGRWLLMSRAAVPKRANISILPNEKRAKLFQKETGTDRPVARVWNCPVSDEAVAGRDGIRKDKFTLFFHGSIVPARIPISLVEALSKLPSDVVIEIAGYETVGHVGYIQTLQNYARIFGVEERLKFLGAFPQRQALLSQCRQADVGLALMPMESTDSNEETMIGASNKPFDYLASGLALLVSDRTDWRDMFVTPGYARPCDPDDPASIAHQLKWFFQHREQTCAMGENGRKRILSEWNYETQFSPILQIMSSR